MTDAPALAALAKLLVDEPAVRAVVNRDPVVAVPDAARAVFVGALAGTTTRRPLVVAVPTGAEAERLARDLGQFLPAADVELFPAWETLPFERVSPSLETMARRLRVMWRLRTGTGPTVVVAPVRALVQRLGPHVEDVEPIVVRPGNTIDRDELVARLVAMGYRREYQVESRGELAVRGSIVDVYPSTDDHPVRIDLWDDEVDRLSAFAVADQRSTHDVSEAWLFPTRELLPTPEVRSRARKLVTSEPWGAEQWERVAEGQVFDGMESWLPWLCEGEHLLPDLLAAEALVLLVEPKRMRDRARELLDEEAALASTLAATWGARHRRRVPPPLARFRPVARAHGSGRRVRPRDTGQPRHGAAARDRVRSRRRRHGCAGRTASCARARQVCGGSRGRGRRFGRSPSRPARGRGHRRHRRGSRRGRDPAGRSCHSSAASCSPPRSWRSSPRPTLPAAAASIVGRGVRVAASTTTTPSSPVTTSCTTSTVWVATSR